MEIGYLCDNAELAPALAVAHVAAFGTLLPDWTVTQALDELRSHRRRCAIPTTLVALEAGDWLGSVSLLSEDHQDIRQYSPWLASLVVRPDRRRRGIGAALTARCVAEAAALGVPTVYLYCTESLVDFYTGMGWRIHDRVAMGVLNPLVLAIDAADAGGAA